MAKLSFSKDTTGKQVVVFIRNTSVSSSVSGLTGLTSGSLNCVYYRSGAVAAALTLTSLASITSTHLTGGFIEVSATGMPGDYRLDLANTMLATGADFVTVMLKGATNMEAVPFEIELLDAVTVSAGIVDANVRWISGTPIGTIATNGYLPVTVKVGGGTGELSISNGQVTIQSGTASGQVLNTSGIVSSNIRQVSGTAIGVPATAGYLPVTVKVGGGTGEFSISNGQVTVQSGTASGQILNVSGIVSSNLRQISGAALSTTAAQIGVNVVTWSATNVTALSSGRMVASVGEYQAGLVPLQPTISTRTLDVTATGAAGIDWGNIENQGTVVSLSQTSISSVATGAAGPTSGEIGLQVWATVVSSAAGSFGERVSRIPNVAAGTSGGFPLADASGATLLSSGTGANQIYLQSGLVTVSGGGDTPPTSGEIATQVWATVIEGSFTAIASMKLQNAAMAGKVTGQETLTPVFRDLSNAVDRITAATTLSGNRTAITYNMA